MSFVCPHCFSSLGARSNVYGTVCSKCGMLIQNETPAPIYKEMKKRLTQQQQQIRQFLRKKILGDSNGNQVK